ncbi:MAG TPA: hypothetical protein VNK52_07950 [Hyphomicrobiaceae bacterium]|nr:hypothetical protein [Hyphomicrobiaceae bacterium]
MLEHPNVLSTRPTVRWERDRQAIVYVIETDLAVSPEDPGYDQTALDNIAEAALARLPGCRNRACIRFERVSLA